MHLCPKCTFDWADPQSLMRSIYVAGSALRKGFQVTSLGKQLRCVCVLLACGNMYVVGNDHNGGLEVYSHCSRHMNIRTINCCCAASYNIFKSTRATQHNNKQKHPSDNKKTIPHCGCRLLLPELDVMVIMIYTALLPPKLGEILHLKASLDWNRRHYPLTGRDQWCVSPLSRPTTAFLHLSSRWETE